MEVNLIQTLWRDERRNRNTTALHGQVRAGGHYQPSAEWAREAISYQNLQRRQHDRHCSFWYMQEVNLTWFSRREFGEQTPKHHSPPILPSTFSPLPERLQSTPVPPPMLPEFNQQKPESKPTDVVIGQWRMDRSENWTWNGQQKTRHHVEWSRHNWRRWGYSEAKTKIQLQMIKMNVYRHLF